MQKVIGDAIVVRVVDYGEADRIATLVTRAAGKVSALARGARRSRKRYAALELFAAGEATLRERRGELWALDAFHVARGFPRLALDVARVAHGAYACELARELAPPHQPEPRLYDLLHQMLALLENDGTVASPGSVHLRVFELALLDLLGLAPALDRCVSCGCSLAESVGDGGAASAQVLDVRRGGVVCPACLDGHEPGDGQGRGVRRELPTPVRLLLLDAQRTPLSALDGRAASGDDERAAWATSVARGTWDGARDVLQALLLEHLGQPLRSVEFISKLNHARP